MKITSTMKPSLHKIILLFIVFFGSLSATTQGHMASGKGVRAEIQNFSGERSR